VRDNICYRGGRKFNGSERFQAMPACPSGSGRLERGRAYGMRERYSDRKYTVLSSWQKGIVIGSTLF
jgi:hypothetical protein